MVSSIEDSWFALITSYIENGKPQSGLAFYRRIRKQVSKIPPAHFFPALLKSCASLQDIETGVKIHVDSIRTGLFENDLFVASSLVDMYSKCGSLAKARQVFDKLHHRNVVLWTALIAGYCENGFCEEALSYFTLMQLEGVHPNDFTYVCSLKACVSLGAIDKAQEIHAEAERKGLSERNVFIGSALVDTYAKCGHLERAEEVFGRLPIHNIVSWTALITGYVEHGFCDEALHCFEQMQSEGISPNALTLLCILKACVHIGASHKGEELHGEIERRGLLKNELLCSSLVHLYANCGMLTKAQQVFDMLPVRDVVSWTVLLAGYVEHGHGEEALKCFEEMQLEGVAPNSFTFVCSLKACGALKAADKGPKLHMEIESWGLTKENMFISSSLIYMYSKCGLLAEARQVFDKLAFRNVVSWNALMTGYVEHSHGESALKCLEQMRLEGVSPDPVTFICCLKACGSIGATDMGAEIHVEIARKGLLARDFLVGNALLDMYGGCGLLAMAQQVFNELPVHDVSTWNNLITGFSRAGEIDNMFCSLGTMQVEGVKPDLFSFLIVLKSCNRSGGVTKSRLCLEVMNRKYGVLPPLEHHLCTIDLLSGAGQLDAADAMICKLPCNTNNVSWNSILCACRYSGQEELGNRAFELSVAGN